MRIKTGEIENFVEFLMSIELVGKRSRMRTRVCKLLSQRLSDLSNEYKQLINEFAEKDEDGNVLTVEQGDGSEGIKIQDINAFNKEVKTLFEEVFVIEETESNKDMLEELKDIVLNIDEMFSGEEALRYDRWCDIVEGIE